MQNEQKDMHEKLKKQLEERTKSLEDEYQRKNANIRNEIEKKYN